MQYLLNIRHAKCKIFERILQLNTEIDFIKVHDCINCN